MAPAGRPRRLGERRHGEGMVKRHRRAQFGPVAEDQNRYAGQWRVGRGGTSAVPRGALQWRMSTRARPMCSRWPASTACSSPCLATGRTRTRPCTACSTASPRWWGPEATLWWAATSIRGGTHQRHLFTTRLCLIGSRASECPTASRQTSEASGTPCPTALVALVIAAPTCRPTGTNAVLTATPGRTTTSTPPLP